MTSISSASWLAAASPRSVRGLEELLALLDHRLVEHLEHLGLQVGAGERCVAQAVDDLALLVHHVVVLEQVLADVEVVRLDPLLRAADRAGHQRVLDDLALLDAQRSMMAGDALGAEEAHEVVLERQEEARRAGIALAAGAAAQLAVDAARLVALGAEDVQPAGIRRCTSPCCRWLHTPRVPGRSAGRSASP